MQSPLNLSFGTAFLAQPFAANQPAQAAFGAVADLAATFQENLDAWRESLRERGRRPGGITITYLKAMRQVVREQAECGGMAMDDALMAAVAMMELATPEGTEQGAGLLADLQACGEPAAMLIYVRAVLSGAVEGAALDKALTVVRQLADDASRPEIQVIAQAMLGDALRLGRDGEADHEAALACYMDAASKGLGSASYMVGLWYDGTSPAWSSPRPNPQAAAFYYTAGIQAGCLRCTTALGLLHLYSRLDHSTPSMGLEMLEVAAQHGEPRAQEALRRREAAAQLPPLEVQAEASRPAFLRSPTVEGVFGSLFPRLARRA